MKEQRHHHPHVDPRQPRNGARPGTNPPVFAWKPLQGQRDFRLTVARDAGFKDLCLDVQDLPDPLFLPEKAFPAGSYFWRWSSQGRESETFACEITPDAVVLEVPPAVEWLKRFPKGHPRIFIRPEDVPALRASRHGDRAGLWKTLRAGADKLLAEPHELDEPPFLPDRRRDYREYFRVWRGVLQDSRRFVKGAQTLALAYLASGQAEYAQAACRRMASVARWDPDGSSHIDHNDEAHMSVIWHGPQACDWVWDRFSDEQRQAVIRQFRRRGEINYEHMHDRGMYGVDRFDSHAGREIVFLAQIAFVFHEHIPEAGKWLEWLRPVLCGIWPIWAGDDGGWAQGPMYATAYVGIQTMFATALKRGAGINMYRRPFWANHARWRRWWLPPYLKWTGFGDCGALPPLEGNADIVQTIQRETGTHDLSEYVAACRAAGPARPGAAPEVSAQRYIAGDGVRPAGPSAASRTDQRQAAAPPQSGILHVFPYVGLAAIRTHPDDPTRDVAFFFRSSPLGAISHSHANNNDFALHVAGEVMAMPSGYYDGYGSAHHMHWVWQTKSHNCLTLSDAGQLVSSHDSVGAVENTLEDESVVYLRGTADASYDRARRCRRHVVFLKRHCCFVLIDEFVAAPPVASALQWNLHSFSPFVVDEDGRAFLIEREASSLEGRFMYHGNAFFSLSEGWDPPPMPTGGSPSPPMQYNLRFSVTALASSQNIGVVLCPGHERLSRAQVVTEQSGRTELARIGDDRLAVNQGGGIEYEGIRSQAVAVLLVDGKVYELTDDGLGRT